MKKYGRVIMVVILLTSAVGCSVVQVRSVGQVITAAEEVACSSSWLANIDSWFWNLWRAAVPFGGQATDTCEYVEE